mmetsp:Transcript_82088/g.145520  ORF Transcript_82088/g.145520 Transcript_82088/m.145520 type:complete len:132 (+) Transcript_82088:442-837(+)
MSRREILRWRCLWCQQVAWSESKFSGIIGCGGAVQIVLQLTMFIRGLRWTLRSGAMLACTVWISLVFGGGPAESSVFAAHFLTPRASCVWWNFLFLHFSVGMTGVGTQTGTEQTTHGQYIQTGSPGCGAGM